MPGAYSLAPEKRREYLESVISSWKNHYSNHNVPVQQWKSDLHIFRESTYISCWNRASSMSLAMWEMYGGGSESVAVRSTSDKLESVLQRNTALLDKHGLMGMLAEVEYVEGLKHPDYKVQEHIYQIMFERERDINVGLFAIKPSVYEFEHEVRAILFPKRELFAPVEFPIRIQMDFLFHLIPRLMTHHLSLILSTAFMCIRCLRCLPRSKSSASSMASLRSANASSLI